MAHNVIFQRINLSFVIAVAQWFSTRYVIVSFTLIEPDRHKQASVIGNQRIYLWWGPPSLGQSKTASRWTWFSAGCLESYSTRHPGRQRPRHRTGFERSAPLLIHAMPRSPGGCRRLILDFMVCYNPLASS